MDNLDIIVFTVIVAVSFITFIIVTMSEFNKMSKNPYQAEGKAGTSSK